MNENDKKVRKQWIIVWVLSLLIGISSTLLQQLFDPSLNAFPLARYGTAAFSLLLLLAFSFVSYHCIYKKPGTKLLTFLLIMTAISLTIIPILYLTGKIRPPVYIPYYGVFMVISEGLSVWWLIVSWRMRKTNKRLQAIEKA